MMEEGKGGAKTQATPTTPGAQVAQGLVTTSTPSVAEEEEESDRAELQRALESMPQTAVSEATLHAVDWSQLGWEFGMNLGGAVALVTFIFFTIWIFPPFPLKLYIMPFFVVLLFLLLVVAVELTVYYFKNPENGCFPTGNKLLMASPLLQAIVGKKILKLPQVSDVYIFAHAIERRPQEAGAFVERVVNPVNPQLPRKILTVGSEEIAPGRWKATGFRGDEIDYSEELSEAANGELYPTLSQVVEGFIFKDPYFKAPCYVELSPPTRLWYFHSLWSHWKVRLLANASMMCFCLLPAIRYINFMHKYKVGYCKFGIDADLPFCGADADGKTCQSKCDSLLDFMGEVGSRIGVEEIEFIWTVCLTVVMIGVLSIYYIRSKHKVLETKFVLGMGSVGNDAESEFMQVRSLLDDNLSFFGIVFGILRQRKAYQSRIKACEHLAPDIYSGAKMIQNQCFWEVTREWRNSQGGKASCKPFHLPMSVPEHNKKDVKGQSQELASWAEKMQTALQEFASFKNFHGLGRKVKSNGYDKDFKFITSVPVTCRESLDLLRSEFFTKSGAGGYSAQLDAIFAAADCQDDPPPSANGKQAGFCHVQEDFRLGPLLIPAGLCLTHVACITASNEILSLEIGKGKDISTREAFLLLFHGKDNPDLNNSLVLDRFSEKYHWPSIMLPSAGKAALSMTKLMAEDSAPVDSQGLAGKVKDAFIYQFYFVFQISPSYFEALKKTEKDSDVSLYGFTEGMFTRLKDAPTMEPKLSGLNQGKLEDLKKQSWRDAKGVSCCLVVEVDKAATMNKAITLIQMLLECFGLVLLCLLFVMIVPMFRHFRWGSEVFPAPFTSTLVFNAAVQTACLVGYFWLFSTASARLDWIGKALLLFEQRTLAPTDPKTKGGKASGASAASTTFREPSTSQDDPFQLFIMDVKDYNPTDASWVAKWQAKERSVLNWSLCARYLRVFVSRTRMTGQAVLVCAALILGVMVLVDVEQGLRGYGAVTTNNQNMLQGMQDKLVSEMRGMVQTEADAAAETAKSFAEGTGAAAAKQLGRRLLADDDTGFNFANASRALALALKPLDAAVHRTQRRQLVDLGEQINNIQKYVNVGDVQHISQSNLLTICMTVLLLVYSLYLLAQIAWINDKVDKHESVVVQVKEHHLHKQSERERLWAKTQGAEDPADAAAEDPATASASAAAAAVEQAQRSYERMLDMTIQSAHDNRGRFPLTLFSFVITQALLVAWLSAAMQPLVQQLQQVVPELVRDACTWAADSDLGSGIEHALENASAAVGKNILHTDKAASIGDHSIVYSLVCVPLLNALNTDLDALGDDVDAAKNETANMNAYGYNQTVDDSAGADSGDRRLLEKARASDKQLLSERSVRRLVEDWWDAHPGGSEAKMELARHMLEDRRRYAQQLLTAGPEAARVALRSRELLAGPKAARKRPHWSKRWLPSFAQRPPLPAQEPRTLFE